MTVQVNEYDSDITVETESLTFTMQNWDENQTVTVTPVTDTDRREDNATIYLYASGGGYSGRKTIAAAISVGRSGAAGPNDGEVRITYTA